MAERRGGARLRPEPLEERGIARQRRVQKLDRDLATELDVVREVDLCGRARADRCDQPIARPEHAADMVGHAREDHQASFARGSRACESIGQTVTGGFARIVAHLMTVG